MACICEPRGDTHDGSATPPPPARAPRTAGSRERLGEPPPVYRPPLGRAEESYTERSISGPVPWRGGTAEPPPLSNAK